MEESGTEATNDSEDTVNPSKHFQKIYNWDDAPVDFSVLDNVKQREIITELEREPEMVELIRAVRVI